MKRALLIFTLSGTLVSGYVQAQTTTGSGSSASDSSKTSTKKKSISITIIGNDDNNDSRKTKIDSLKQLYRKRPGGFFSLTFTRLDIGFSKLVDNGSFTLSPPNRFLDYKSGKTSNVGFDILQLGYRFNSNFRMYVAGGFDWNHIRLENNITMKSDAPVLDYTTETIVFDKNRFSSTYIRIPAAFDFRSKNDRRGKSFHIVFGPEAGFLVGGKVKQKSSENGKQKIKDDFHFTEFRYGAYARIGYGGAGLFYKQYFNDMFENSPAQAGLKNMAFGLMLGF